MIEKSEVKKIKKLEVSIRIAQVILSVVFIVSILGLIYVAVINSFPTESRMDPSYRSVVDGAEYTYESPWYYDVIETSALQPPAEKAERAKLLNELNRELQSHRLTRVTKGATEVLRNRTGTLINMPSPWYGSVFNVEDGSWHEKAAYLMIEGDEIRLITEYRKQSKAFGLKSEKRIFEVYDVDNGDKTLNEADLRERYSEQIYPTVHMWTNYRECIYQINWSYCIPLIIRSIPLIIMLAATLCISKAVLRAERGADRDVILGAGYGTSLGSLKKSRWAFITCAAAAAPITAALAAGYRSALLLKSLSTLWWVCGAVIIVICSLATWGCYEGLCRKAYKTEYRSIEKEVGKGTDNDDLTAPPS